MSPRPGAWGRELAGRAAGFGRGVAVIGMHRSGTSAATRVVNLLGVPLGDPADLIEAMPSNLKGHWESNGLMRVNDRLLADLGGTWWAPPELRPGWESAPSLRPLRTEAVRTFARIYRTRTWAWKDPRNCLTLPFWRAALRGDWSGLLVLRSPLEIAASLEARNGYPLAYGLALWERYLRAALAGLEGLPVLVTTFQSLLEDPVAWSQAAGAFLRDRGFATSTPAPAELAAFVDPGLRHVAPAAEPALGALTPAQRELEGVLAALEGRHEVFRAPVLAAEAPELQRLFAARGALAEAAATA